MSIFNKLKNKHHPLSSCVGLYAKTDVVSPVHPMVIIFLFLSLFCFSGVSARDAKDQPSYIGTNIEGINDYSGDWPFIDRMKNSREWITFDSTGVDKTWDTKVSVPMDENGYPLRIPFDPDDEGPIPPQGVRTILFNNFENYPKGTYTVRFEGKGRIHFRVDAKCPHLPNGQCIFSDSNTVHKFEVKKPSLGGIRMKILESDPSDHVRNIQVLMPGFKSIDADSVFHPLFIERLRGFKVLRFMNWASTNHSRIQEWEHRVRTTYVSFARKGRGAPYEYMIALANQVGADPWFTIPTYADDDHVRRFARLIHASLDPGRKVYIEYSNEVWNGVFPQEDYAKANGKLLTESLGLKVGKIEANAYFYAKRSAEIFRIFEEEFPASRALVKVVAGQTMNPWVMDRILNALENPAINPSGQKVDAIAIALYVGAAGVQRLLTQNGKVSKRDVELSDVGNIDLDDIFAEAMSDLKSRRKPNIVKHKSMAENVDAELLAYEGGQGMQVHLGYKRDVVGAMTDKLILANRDPRMKNLYREILDTWFGAGGSHFVNFSYIYQPNRWGMWGVLEYQSQPLEEAYKFQALREGIEKIEAQSHGANTE